MVGTFFCDGCDVYNVSVMLRHICECFLYSVLVLQAAGDTEKVDAGADNSRYLDSASSNTGVPLRLTAYDLPASTVYYLPAGHPGRIKAVNQTRPLANGYPAGWKILFHPAALSGSNKRW